MFGSKRRGTTLVELMVSGLVLPPRCRGGRLFASLRQPVRGEDRRAVFSRRRALILAACENTMDTTRAAASQGTILTGASTQSLVVAGLESSVTITETITLQASYTDLYLVDVSANWNEHPAVGVTRADSLVLDTYIRTNDT